MAQLAGLRPAPRKRRHWDSSLRLSDISTALESDKRRAQRSTYLALRVGEGVGRGDRLQGQTRMEFVDGDCLPCHKMSAIRQSACLIMIPYEHPSTQYEYPLATSIMHMF